MQELYRIRGPVSLRFIQHMEAVQQYEKEKSDHAGQRELKKLLKQLLCVFIQHLLVDEWKA